MNAKRLIIILTALTLLTGAWILYYNLGVKGGRSVGEYAASIDAMIFGGNYSGAIEECSDGLRHYPESTELYILKARAYMLSGDTGKAIGTLDYGYKQTQSDDILERRMQITGELADNVGFIPLTETDIASEDPGNSPAASGGVSGGGEIEREPYVPDSTIRITIPNVLPPA